MTGFDSKRQMAQAKQEPTPWRDMVVVSLVREGINKHKARELADHFAVRPVQEPVACRFCHSKKGCWAWQCYNCGEIVSRCQTLPRFAKLEQLFGSKVSNDFVLSDIICTVETKLKEKQND